MFDRFVMLPLAKMVKANWNYKEDNDALLEKLKANIKRNGQIENIIVRQLDTGFYEVVNGNHRFDAMSQLGLTEAICFDLGKISDAQARRIAVETNETKFGVDNIKLAEIVSEIMQEFDDMGDLSSTMPYSPEELENFSKLLSFDWDQYGSKEGGGEDDGGSKDKNEEGFLFKIKSAEDRQFWCDALGIDGSMDTYTVEQWKRLHKEEES